jgi:hypothetical protein
MCIDTTPSDGRVLVMRHDFGAGPVGLTRPDEVVRGC